MLATHETAELLNPLTYDTVLQYLDGSDPFNFAGHWAAKDSFIYGVVFNSDDFIDWDNRKANFDNDEFIKTLEIAKRLPDSSEHEGVRSTEDMYLKLRNGEQLLLEFFIRGLNDFRIAKAYIGDTITVGEPTSTGGKNRIIFNGFIGIYAKSPNQDAAWSFIRQILLPEMEDNFHALAGNGIPVLIDKFEEHIAELMTPKFYKEDVPSMDAVAGDEEPQIFFGSFSHPDVIVFAMTEAEAQEIRSIIDSSAVGSRRDNSMQWIIYEEYHAFLNGLRSAADTARILQNRVQTYLNEQG